MITVTFSHLIKSGAILADSRLSAAAKETTVLSGIEMNMPCIILLFDLVITPVCKCVYVTIVRMIPFKWNFLLYVMAMCFGYYLQ